MPCYCHYYRQSLLCRWDFHFDYHHRSQMIYNLQDIGSNAIFLHKTYPLPVFKKSLEDLLPCQFFYHHRAGVGRSLLDLGENGESFGSLESIMGRCNFCGGFIKRHFSLLELR